MSKRLFDLIFSAAGLIVLSPLLAAIALWVKLDSPGPVFFRQTRVGQYGRIFQIHKFRTMVTVAQRPQMELTVGADDRITRSGRILRKYKLDELPQLFDVVRGKMSLVGPRPEVPRYVSCYPDAIRDLVLSVKPGITDSASIQFRNENEILALSETPERTYIEEILPSKLEHYVRYAREHSLMGDLRLIAETLKVVFS